MGYGTKYKIVFLYSNKQRDLPLFDRLRTFYFTMAVMKKISDGENTVKPPLSFAHWSLIVPARNIFLVICQIFIVPLSSHKVLESTDQLGYFANTDF
jgi:hypothetical protein